MPFTEREARVIAALVACASSLTMKELSDCTQMSPTALRTALGSCERNGQAADARHGWRATSRGRMAIRAPRYRDILREMEEEVKNNGYSNARPGRGL